MKAQFIAVVIFSALICMAYGGDDLASPPQPKSPAAVAAIHRRDAEAAKAKEACLKALIAADDQEIADLQPAFIAATKAANLDEAEAIKAQCQAATEDEKRQKELMNPKVSKWASWASGRDHGDKRWVFTDGTAIFLGAGNGTMTGNWTRKGDIIKFAWPSGSQETFWLDADGKPVRGRWDNDGREIPVEYIGTDLTGADPPPDSHK